MTEPAIHLYLVTLSTGERLQCEGVSPQEARAVTVSLLRGAISHADIADVRYVLTRNQQEPARTAVAQA